MPVASTCCQPMQPSASSELCGYELPGYSLVSRSLQECKENILLVCIAFVDALDHLQERLHLPLGLVKELQRKLSKMVDRSLVRPVPARIQRKLEKAESLGKTLTASTEPWHVLLVPQQLRGFVSWLLALVRSINELVVASAMGICRRIYVFIMTFPGVPTACMVFCHIFNLIDQALHLTAASESSTTAASSSPRHKLQGSPTRESYVIDPALTAVVLEYREKESIVPTEITRRIQRVMHFPIPLRSFEATVRLPKQGCALPHQSRSIDEMISTSSISRRLHHKSISPRSIPVSPMARRRVQIAFSHFSDEVLYQARDRLRRERAITLTGDGALRIPRFNAQDCDEDVRLTCGQNCATKIGTGLYRSVRGTVPLWKNRLVYFEMSVRELTSPLRRSPAGINTAVSDTSGSSDLSLAIGLSTQAMPLNTLVGSTAHSVGYYSAGQVMVNGGQRCAFVSTQRGFECSSTIGVLARINQQTLPHNSNSDGPPAVSIAQVRFSVDGVAVRDASSNEILVVSFPLSTHTDLFPTVSLHSQHVQVYARFTAPDVIHVNLADFAQDPQHPVDIWCLDGLKITGH